jgi:hypothetical protein
MGPATLLLGFTGSPSEGDLSPHSPCLSVVQNSGWLLNFLPMTILFLLQGIYYRYIVEERKTPRKALPIHMVRLTVNWTDRQDEPLNPLSLFSRLLLLLYNLNKSCFLYFLLSVPEWGLSLVQ